MNQNNDTSPQPVDPSPVVPPPVLDWKSADLSTSAPVDPWQTKYEKEKKRSLLLAVTTAGASVLAVVALVWGIAQSPTSAVTNASAGLAGGATGQLPGGTAGQLPGGGPGGMDPATELFNADGSVDSAAVEQFFAMMPPGLDAAAMIDQMESDGAITSEQADALRAAAADVPTSSGTSGGATGSTSDTFAGSSGSVGNV